MTNTDRLSIKQDYFFMIMAIIPYIFPYGITSLPLFAEVSKLKYISIIILLLVLVRHKNGIRIRSSYGICMVSFLIELLIVTIIKSGYIDQAFKLTIEILYSMIWSSYMFKRYPKETLRFLTRYYTLVVALNLLFEILLPGGFAETKGNTINFLGDDNKIIFFLIPALALSLSYLYRFKNKSEFNKLSVLLFLMYFISEVYIWAATGMVIIAVIAIMIWVVDKNKMINRFFSLRNCLIIVGIICFLVLFRNNIFREGIIGSFITNILGKTVTFSGRITLWQQAIPRVMQHPIFGYGISQNSERAFIFNTAAGLIEGFSAHNGYLLITLRGGLVGLSLFIFSLTRLIEPARKTWSVAKDSRIISYSLIGFLVGCIFEAEFYSFIFIIMLQYLINIPKLEKMKLPSEMES